MTPSGRVPVNLLVASACTLMLVPHLAFSAEDEAEGRPPTGFGRPGLGGMWGGRAGPNAAEWGRQRDRSGQTPPTEPIKNGFVILDGQYVPPPYTLELAEGTLRLNDMPIQVRLGFGLGGSWPPFGAGGRRWGSSPRMLTRVERGLRNDCLLVRLRGEPCVLMSAYDAERILSVILLDETSRESKIESLLKLGIEWANSGHWGSLIDSFEPGPGLADRVVALREKLAQKVIEAPEESQGSGEPDLTFARVGGLLSVVLATCAFGVLLTHVPPRDGRWFGLDTSQDGGRRVLFLVGVLVVLNIFDMVFTVMAAAAGAIYELNPLVERHIGSPVVIGAFKMGLLAAGASALVAFRRYRLTQVASWWAALCYTVVTLRWATLNSVFID